MVKVIELQWQEQGQVCLFLVVLLLGVVVVGFEVGEVEVVMLKLLRNLYKGKKDGVIILVVYLIFVYILKLFIQNRVWFLDNYVYYEYV